MRESGVMVCCLVLLLSCGDDPATAPSNDDGAKNDQETPIDGVVSMGSVTMGGETFLVTREGPCVLDREVVFSVIRLGDGVANTLEMWVENVEGKKISAPVRKGFEGDHWQFRLTPKGGEGDPQWGVLRRKMPDRDTRSQMYLHRDAVPIRGGVAALIIDDGEMDSGFLELTLHEDEGRLDLWLARDGAMKEPMSLPIDAVIEARFPTLGDRAIEFRARDDDRKQDGGKTHHFVFPGSSETGAAWLRIDDFRSPLTISFSLDGEPHTAGPFVLVPGRR